MRSIDCVSAIYVVEMSNVELDMCVQSLKDRRRLMNKDLREKEQLCEMIRNNIKHYEELEERLKEVYKK